MPQEHRPQRVDISRPSRKHELQAVDVGELEGGLLLIGCSGFRFSAHEEFAALGGQLLLEQTAGGAVRSRADGWATLEYAVGMVDVKNVAVCGHEDCRIVRDSLKVTEPARSDGVEGDLVSLRERFREGLLDLEDNKVRADRLSRLNVRFQVQRLIDTLRRRGSSDRESELSVHGWFWSRRQQQVLDLAVTRTMKG